MNRSTPLTQTTPLAHLTQLPDAELESQASPPSIVPFTARRLLPRFRVKNTSNWSEGAEGVGEEEIDFSSFKLPYAVENAKRGWENSLNAVALVTVLLAGMEAELLSLLPVYQPGEASSIIALRIFSYSSLLVNLAGTIACVLMIDSLADLPTGARELCMADPNSLPRLVYTQQAKIPQDLLYSRNERQLLYLYGLEVPWGFFNFFWAWAFPTGTCCIVAQILIYVWTAESALVAGILTPLGIAVLVPLVAGFIQTRRT